MVRYAKLVERIFTMEIMCCGFKHLALLTGYIVIPMEQRGYRITVSTRPHVWRIRLKVRDAFDFGDDCTHCSSGKVSCWSCGGDGQIETNGPCTAHTVTGRHYYCTSSSHHGNNVTQYHK